MLQQSRMHLCVWIENTATCISICSRKNLVWKPIKPNDLFVYSWKKKNIVDGGAHPNLKRQQQKRHRTNNMRRRINRYMINHMWTHLFDRCSSSSQSNARSTNVCHRTHWWAHTPVAWLTYALTNNGKHHQSINQPNLIVFMFPICSKPLLATVYRVNRAYMNI